jgi:hypothetical protein
MKLTTTPTGMAITKRFFLALDVAINQRKARGIRSFTESHSINYWNFSTFKKCPDGRAIKSEWLAWIVEDYNVNAEWLLTGVGMMFKTQNNP